MQVALICEKCGHVHNDKDEATLIVDFRQKYLSFICQNKQCKHDNIFRMDTWVDNVKKSPLPRMRTI
jgi:hypothetical protein